MTKSSRESRREAARRQQGSGTPRWVLPTAGLAVVVVALLAIVLSQGAGNTAATGSPSASSGAAGDASATAASSSSTGASATTAASATTRPSVVVGGPPAITGTPLPTFTGAANDPARGLAAPLVDGYDYSGQPVSIAPTGRVTIVLFAAHWCPHCQREIPVIQAWVDAGGKPADVDIVTVSTGIDATLPNYPPEAWFAREGWTAPVIVDPTNTVAAAYGLASYPYFVILDGAGNVYARLSGEIPTDQLERVLATVPRI